MRRKLTRRYLIAVPLAAVVLFAAGCGDDDSNGDSSSTSTSGGATTTTSGEASAIRTLQSELDTLGCGAGATDGQLGPETEAAIRHFQAAAGLTVDGIVGVQTRAALGEAAQSGSPNCRSTPAPPTTAATTTTAGTAPACSEQEIAAAVQAAQQQPGNQTVNQYECSGNWAFAAVTTPDPNSFEYTALLNWYGGSWHVVDRATYCENGSVPQNIFQQACESN